MANWPETQGSPPGADDDHRQASRHDLPPTIVKHRYAVLSVPRSGSTMLCSALWETGLAGRPEEYFQRRPRAQYKQRPGLWTIDAILEDVQRRRTTSNGVFGLKIHAADYADMFGQDHDNNAGQRFLSQFDRLVLCFRRRKIDQAISNILAIERRVWTNKGSDRLEFPARLFRPADIEAISLDIARMAGQERFWRETIARTATPAIEVAYEDLAADPNAVIGRVLAFLDLRLPPESVPAPTTRRLADDSNALMKEAYLEAIGEGG